ncbi:hypothetical protein ERD95_03135 [Enterobacteriaceae bacterium ML5]|nr:hypothetical protein ERD95_03135 [Enterobacteriaceae bacterium ML5]
MKSSALSVFISLILPFFSHATNTDFLKDSFQFREEDLGFDEWMNNKDKDLKTDGIKPDALNWDTPESPAVQFKSSETPNLKKYSKYERQNLIDPHTTYTEEEEQSVAITIDLP